MRRNIFAALLSVVMACARPEPAPRPAVVWTNADGTPAHDPGRTTESIRHRERERAAGASAAPQEPNVPRLRCNDGTRSIHCSPGANPGNCCPSQGGVYHDLWGNLVYE